MQFKNLYITIALFILFQSNYSFGQGWMPQGARSAGISHASVTMVDLFSFHHNPGALAFMENGGAAVSYEARFLLRELQTQSFIVASPISNGMISFGGQFYGYESFRTNRVGGGYSLLLADNLAAGLQMNYMSLRLDPFYGVKHAFSGELGMMAQLNDQIDLGFSVFNIGRARLSDFNDDRFATILRLGTGIKVMDELKLYTEISQEVTEQTSLRFGVEYQPNEVLYIRCGGQGGPVAFSFGTGVNLGQFRIDIATGYDQILGWTPSAAFLWHFNAKPKDF
jgi:hypothetical protein